MVRINVSPATYEELRSALIRKGDGGVFHETGPDAGITMGDVTVAKEPTRVQPGINYKTELERAYRAIRGIYGMIVNGRTPDRTMLAYHSPTLAAAARFVHDGALDGAEYFVGKHVSVLHEALDKYK